MNLDHGFLLLICIGCIPCLCISSQVVDASFHQCPINFSYVSTIPWDSSSCQGNIVHANPSSIATCCQTLTSLIGIGTATYLKQAGRFRLPNVQASVSCLSDFQAEISRLHLSPNLTSTCFRAEQFVNTTNICSGVQTRHDWERVLGKVTALDGACRADVADPSACDACVLAGFQVMSRLLAIDSNNSHPNGCFYYTVLYAAGIVHEFGPVSFGAISCIFGLPLLLQSRASSSAKRALVFAPVGAAAFAIVVMACFVGCRVRCGRDRRNSQKVATAFPLFDPEENALQNWRPKTGSKWFKFCDLERATGKFSDNNLIGRGQFGTVYKGTFSDGTTVAVKRLQDWDIYGDDEFHCNFEIISTLKHRNLVPLRGYCISDSDRYVIYDYMPNGNLNDRLFPQSKDGNMPMTWPQRKSVILDIANALAYLHYGVQPPIYHRDIKPTNILLDPYMRARVADFGLAKQVSREANGCHHTTRVVGTHGYLAPEYAIYGQLTEKSDVYSFGILVLEVMCGRKALDLSNPSALLITDWAWALLKAGKVNEALDPGLFGPTGERCRIAMLERYVRVGILCAHLMVALRPTMLEALRMLEGDIEVPNIPDRPLYL